MEVTIRKNTIYYYILLLFIFYHVVLLNSGYVAKVGFLVVAATTIIGTIFFDKIVNYKLFYMWLFYFIILFLNYLAGDQYFDFIKFLSEAIQFLLLIIILIVFNNTPRGRIYFQKLAIFGLVMTSLICLTTLPILISNPTLFREKELFSEELSVDGSYKWLASYSMIHGIFVLFPIIIFIIKAKEIRVLIRASFVTIGLILFLVVFLSNATTPLFLALLTIMLSVFLKPSKTYKSTYMFVRFFLLPLMGLLFVEFYMNDFLLFIQDFYSSGSSNYKKIDGIVKYGLSSSPRQYYYMISMKSFETYPIFGTNDLYGIGQHSFFLDRLSALGILGFSILSALIFNIYRYIYKSLTITRIFFIVGFLSTLILWLLKNVISFEMLLYPIIILPGLCIFAENELKKYKHEHKI